MHMNKPGRRASISKSSATPGSCRRRPMEASQANEALCLLIVAGTRAERLTVAGRMLGRSFDAIAQDLHMSAGKARDALESVRTRLATARRIAERNTRIRASMATGGAPLDP